MPCGVRAAQRALQRGGVRLLLASPLGMTVTSSVSSAADNAVHEAGPWIVRLARVGFLAKALLYITIGALAALAAFNLGGKSGTDSRGAMAELMNKPFGRVLLGVIALGLFGYAVWRIVEAIKDPERRGRNAKGIALRLKSFATGLVHLGLAYSAAHFAVKGFGSGNSRNEAKAWTARALETPGGLFALYAVAAAFIGYGLYQLYKAAKSKLAKQLSLGSLTGPSRNWVILTSRFGIAARGIVFGMIGVMLARATMHRNPSEAGGPAESMRELTAFGHWPFVAIAVGLIAYGVYQVINAKYRRIYVR